MRCPGCGREIDRKWTYCPYCGFRVKKDFFTSIFERVFQRFNREFREIEKLMERDFEALDISQYFRPKHTRGFSIKIVSQTGKPPKITVRSWGIPKQRLEQAVKQELKQKLPVVETTEEPKAEIRRTDSKVLVDLELPGVKSENDISVQELSQSVEVRALAGKKAYFKIITKPPQFRLVKKSFSDGKLHLEFA